MEIEHNYIVIPIDIIEIDGSIRVNISKMKDEFDNELKRTQFKYEE
jgi:hypothetical protein